MTGLVDSAGTRFVFFFQAEDGIRDVAVTGVQTCALPICLPECDAPAQWARRADRGRGEHAADLRRPPGGRSEERRVGKSVDLGGRRIIKKKKRKKQWRGYEGK